MVVGLSLPRFARNDGRGVLVGTVILVLLVGRGLTAWVTS